MDRPLRGAPRFFEPWRRRATRPAPDNLMPGRPFGGPVVTFDKGGRVARLEAGAHLDARQVGILFAKLSSTDGGGRTGRLDDWDRARDPGATRRIEGMLAAKGPEDKGTLLLALSMNVLTSFTVIDHDERVTYRLDGTRSGGYTVTSAEGS